MAFIFLRTDAFLNNARGLHDADRKEIEEARSKRPIRRPYRGIQIKEDTYSTLSILKPNGKPINLISSSDTNRTSQQSKTGKVVEYSDYILQSVSQQRVEKQQIIETFGDPYVYFFGERPRMLEVQGMLVNTEDFNWHAQFWKNYDENLRGTKLVQQNARVYLSFDTVIVEGYILQAQANQAAQEPYSIPFGFSMLVTDYLDWSDIGQTRFPGFDEMAESLDVLNRELMDRRSQFVSTTAQVRLKNLLAGPGGGTFGALRAGIRSVNKGLTAAGSLIDKVHNVVGGRTVRVPVGIAGFLQSTGAAQIGVGGLGGSAVLSASGLGQQYDAATGTFKGVNGSVKLRMPGHSMFAPSWVSDVTKQAGRGYIFENYDEYALRGTAPLLAQLMSTSNYLDVVSRKIDRQVAIEETEFRTAMHVQLLEAGDIFGDLADGVGFVKNAFGMVMTGLSFASDWEGSLKATLGIPGGETSQSRIAGRRDELEKQGIKTAYEDKSILSRVGNFIGGSALRTFEGAATAEVDNPEAAAVGKAYENDAQYDATTVQSQQDIVDTGEDRGLEYEQAYGNENYTNLVGTDPETQATLEELYGNTDGSNDVDPSVLEAVYGTGSSSTAVRTPAEVAAILASIQGNSVESDEDRTGIRGVAELDAPIDPVI